jgi:hypothetical protein
MRIMRHRKATAGIAGRIREFFFAEEVPYGLAIARITLPLVLFVDLLRRWPYVRELYSADGATTPLWNNYGFTNPFPELPGAAAVALFTLLLAACVTSSLGWMTRTSLAIASALYFYFTTLDSTGTITKYTVIAGHVLPLLALSNCGAVLSLDSLRRPVAGPRFPIWPARLIQIFIGVVYFGAAMTKVHTPSYFNGDQMMFWMVTHVNGHHPIGEVLAYYPGVLAAGAYVAVVWEILFVFLTWRGWVRAVMLAMGVGFHVATWVTLGLDIFPCVMIASYFAFMTERDAYRCGRWINRAGDAVGVSLRNVFASAAGWVPARRLGPAAYFAALWAVALVGAAGERAYDPYGEHGVNGPMALRELEPAAVSEMMVASGPLRVEDQVFSFEIGTGLFADALVGRKAVFEKGENLTAQCILAPPHPDMYIECNLHSADGRLIDRSGMIVTREVNRQNFAYAICDSVPAGDYELVLKLAGNEITRRKFSVIEPGSGQIASQPSAGVPPALMAN